MSTNNNGTLVIQAIRPFSQDDKFPVQFQNEIKGGFHSVETLTDRDNIPEPRLQEGMLVYVKENDMVYQYKEIEDPENPGTFMLGWQEAQLGGGGGDLTKELADTYYASINHRHDATYAPLYHSHYWTDLQKNLQGDIPGSSITDLQDVPDFTGHQNKILRINQDEDGIEYHPLNITLNDLNDGPGNIYATDDQGNYVNANKMIQIREDGQGWKLISFDPNSLQVDLKSNYGIDPVNILTTNHLNQPNGVPQLDSNQKIALTQLPTEVVQNTIRVVNSVQDLSSILNPVEGMQQYVSDEDKTFIYNGTTWIERSVNYSVDVRWSNINGRPVSSVLNIDDAVNKRHEHTNKIILDNTTASFTEDQRAKLAGIENFAISKSTQDSLYKLNSWKPNIFTDINNLLIANSKDGDVLAFDPINNRYVNKSLSDVTLIDAVDEALYANNSGLLNGKQDSYFQKNIYKSSTDPQTYTVLYENDMWLNFNDYTLSIWKGQEWIPVAGSGSDIDDIISNLNSIIDNNTIINNNGRLEVKEENLILTKQNITDFTHTHTQNDITLNPGFFYLTQQEKDYWNQKIGQTDINQLITNENRMFVTQLEKNNWNQKQDKNGTLQINLNSELLNGQRLNDNQQQATDIIWSSQKIQNSLQLAQLGLFPKEEVIDIVSSDVGLTPNSGDKYLIINGTDAFVDQDNNIQEYNGTTWDFIIPEQNELRFIQSLNITYIFDGNDWIKFTSSASHSSLTNLLGGQDGKYYHLSEELYNKLQSMDLNINSDNVIEGTNNLFLHSIEERNYLTYITNNGIPQEDVVTNDNMKFVSQQEKDYWNSGQSSLKAVDETSPLYIINNKISIYKQTALQDGYMSKEDKNKLNYLEILSIPPNSVLAWNETIEKFTPQDIADVTGQVKTFVGLLDTPSNYVGSNRKFVMQDEASESLVFQEIRLEHISNFPTQVTPQDLVTMNNYKHTHTPQELSALADLGINWFNVKNKINTIQENANYYVHPATHSQDMITTTTNRMFVSQQEKDTWNNKQDKLSYIPENSQNKGIPGGYQSLNADGIIPLSQLPISIREIKTVPDIQARDALTGLYQGLRVFVIDASQDPNVVSGNKEYIYDGTQWQQIDYNVNVSMNYEDLIGIPVSTPEQIDEAVSKMHEHDSSLILIEQQVVNSHVHSNKSILDQIPILNNQTNKVLKVNELGQLYWQNDGIGNIVIDSTDIGDRKVLIYDQQSSKFVYGDMVTTWEKLDKTSSDITDIQNVPEFTGYGNLFVKVNETEDGLVYSNVIDGGEW